MFWCVQQPGWVVAIEGAYRQDAGRITRAFLRMVVRLRSSFVASRHHCGQDFWLSQFLLQQSEWPSANDVSAPCARDF